MPQDANHPVGRWYHTWWGVILIVLGVVAVALGVAFAIFTAEYWWQIKQGRGAVLMQDLYAGFTHVVNDGQAPSRAVNRQELEAVDFHTLGNPNAPVTIVQFIDFKCPNSKAAAPIVRRLVQKYGRQVKLIVRHFPAESIHPGATELSELAHCAYLQGDFWGLHDFLFQEQDYLPIRLSRDDIGSIAERAGLDKEKMKECMRAGKGKVAVNRDYADGYKFGVVGTPTFFVNGDKVQGVVPWEAWEEFLKNF